MTDSNKSVSPLRRRMLDDMTMRKLKAKTQAAYLRAVKNFTRFFGRSHQPGDALSANPPTLLLKLSMDARRTISATGIFMNLPDTLSERRITDTAR